MRSLKYVLAFLTLILAGVHVLPDQARAQPGVTALSCTPPAADPEIASLARALNYDLDLIREYIYYNIEYTPTFGSKKGALGTLLDKSGNNIDQNVLFVTLLRQSCIAANYRYGGLSFSGDSVANLLGVQNDIGVFAHALGTGGIPGCIMQSQGGACLTSGSGPAAAVGMTMVWTEATVNGTTYEIDPSFKSYAAYTPINMAAATGYSQSAFLNSVLSGSGAGAGLPAGTTSIRSLSKTNLTNQLNTYAANLASYIKKNYPAASAKQIFGGRQIVKSNLGPLPAVGTLYSDLPASLETAYTVTVSNNANGSSPTLSTTLYGSQIQGRRLTLLYDTSNRPTIYLEGKSLVSGAAATGATQTVSLTVQNPFTASFSTYTARPVIAVGGKFAIVLSSGEVGRDELTRHQDAIAKLTQSNASLTGEPMVGEALAAVGTHYLAQSSRGAQLIGNLGGANFVYQNAMGVVGASKSTYVDFPGLIIGGYRKSTSLGDNALVGQSFDVGIYASALESITIAQLQGIEAVSTVRMFNYANTDATSFIQATPANWASIKPTLTNWPAADLAEMSTWLSASSTNLLFIPQNGARTVGIYKGSGYYAVSRSGSIAAGNLAMTLSSKITGGYNGGYGAYGIPSFYASPISISNSGLYAGSLSGSSLSNIDPISTYSVSYSSPGSSSWLSPPYSFEPINLLTGAYTYDHEDLSVGNGDFPLKLTLKSSYDSSRAAARTVLGAGWRHNLMMSAAVDSDSYAAFGDDNPLAAVQTAVSAYVGSDLMATSAPNLSNTVAASVVMNWMMDQLVGNTVTVRLDGEAKKFVKIPASASAVAYVPPPGDASSLVVNADKTMVLTDKNLNVLSFNANGNITSWKDANTNTASFAYDTSALTQKLTSVSNNLNRRLTFTYDGSGNLNKVSDGTRTVTYAVSSSNLASFSDAASAQTSFSYQSGAPGYLTRTFYPTAPSTAFMTNTYDTFGRVTTQADALSNVWTYMFASGYRSMEVNPEGGAHVLYYDEHGNQILDVNQVGDTTVMAYDGIGRRISTTNPNKDSVVLTYDASNNVLTQTTRPIPGMTDVITGQAATPAVRTFTYDPTFNKVLTATDALGNVTRTAYDARGNVLSVTQPGVARPGLGGLYSPITSYTYNALGQVLTSTDAEGRVTAYGYNGSTGDLLTVTRDSIAGRLNLATSYSYDGVGNVTRTTDPRGYSTTTTYDNRRNPLQVTDATGAVTQYAYDALGRQTQELHSTGNASAPWRTTTTAYDVRGKVSSVTQPDNIVKTSAYDTVQRLSTETWSSGRQTLYNYDAASNLTRITDRVSGSLDGSITLNRGTVVRQQNSYYAGGLPATLTDANGNVTTYNYDGFLRLEAVTHADSTSSVPDIELHGYDANGNERVVQKRGGAQVWTTYDALNRPLTKAPTGQPTISYTYDRTGLPVTTQSSADASAYQYSYDTAGRVTGEYAPQFGWITATFDANGNRTSLTYPGATGLKIAFDYDAANRLRGVYQDSVASGVRIAGYSYDSLSQRTAASYGAAGAPVASSALAYTSAGQIATLTHNWNGSSLTLSYGYNTDHNRKSLTASDNSFLPSGLASTSTSYAGNRINQYTSLTGSGAASYAYDRRGDLTYDGVWNYGYDTENRLVSASKAGTSVTYAYDPLGRRLSKTVNGATTAYASFGNQELVEYTGTGTSLSYARLYVYGPGLDEPVASVVPGNVRTYYFQDSLGSVIALANAAGQVTEKYGYTGFGLNSLTGSGTSSIRYAGRRYDAETGLYHNRARAYSPTLGRFLQPDPTGTKGGINLYAYALNNPVNATDPTGNASLFGGQNSWFAAEGADALELSTAESWGNPNTLADHFARHGADFGATSEADYANQASQFLQRSQAEGLPTQIDANGGIRVYDPNTNTFGAYNANGTTRTFYQPSSPTYWSRQPGVAPTIFGGP